MNTPIALYSYRAEILRSERDEDAARLRSLFEQPGYQIVDALRMQVADLIRTSHPSLKMDARATDAAVGDYYMERKADCGVWAHYPWARRVVRVLPESEFVKLRTDRNQQKITAAEQSLLATKKIGVVGLSVGQSVALTLALERSCGEIRLTDFDVIDLSNLNRLRCGIHNIGIPKAVVAAREIAELDPYLQVTCFNEGYTDDMAETFLQGLDLVVDECDSLDVKLRLREAARERRIPVLMNTSDRGMTDIERFDKEPERPLFHGRLKDIRPEALAGLSTEEKVPIVLDIIGLSSSSARLRASMVEIEQSIKTWPQLASDVALGGAVICDVARRLLLGDPILSGRYYLDLADVGGRPASAEVQEEAVHEEAPLVEPKRNGGPWAQVVEDAILAPSAGNVQPWHWLATDDGLALKYRRTDQSSVLYHDDKAAMVGLGATLESALISASHHGLQAETALDMHGHTIAKISLAQGGRSDENPLYSQLARRRSVRTRPETVVTIPPAILPALRAQVERYPGLELAWLDGRADVEALGQLVGEAERLRILDPESHADMVREIAWSDSQHRRSGEGIPLASLSLSATEEAGLQIVSDSNVIGLIAEWNLGSGLCKLNRELVSSSSAMGLLWSRSGTAYDYLSGGRALQRIWLEATRADVGLCPITAICYLLSAWRAGRTLTPAQTAAMPEMDQRFRALFNLPESRSDIVLFRLLPAKEELSEARTTFRRPQSATLPLDANAMVIASELGTGVGSQSLKRAAPKRPASARISSRRSSVA